MPKVLTQPPTWHTEHVLCFPSRIPLLYILLTWNALLPPTCGNHILPLRSMSGDGGTWNPPGFTSFQTVALSSLNLLFSWCIRTQCGVGEWGLRTWWQTRSVEIPFQPLTTFLNLGKLLRLSESLSICKKEIIVYTLGTWNNSHKMAYAPATTFNTSTTYPLSGEKMIDSIFSRD